MFLVGIHGRLAPAAMLTYPEWEIKIIQPILKEHSKESKELQKKVEIGMKTHIIDYVILITLTIAVIVYRVIHTIQMIFVELSAHIDRGFPPSPINGTGMVLAFVNYGWVCRAIYW